MNFNTPVLLMAWCRPHTTKRVIDAIRAVRPTQMFIACDGPRLDQTGEKEKVAATRELIEQEIDWPCSIERRYSAVNQGCKTGISNAISWFFQNVESGIILEDDCVPNPDFFNFCSTLLDLYSDDDRVWAITGNNFQNGIKRGYASYYFSIYGHIWGWATWRRAWKYYQVDMSFWPQWKSSKNWKEKTPNFVERMYLSIIFDKVYSGKYNTWDYQWMACCWYHDKLAIVPNCNLVKNIGFDEDPTHNRMKISQFENMSTHFLGELIHPSNIFQDENADKYISQSFFGFRFALSVVTKYLSYTIYRLINRN